MENNLIPELITEIAKDFTNHLHLPNNDQILFSGRFGKGKTTFLQEYFSNTSKYSSSAVKYNTFYLKPVNYSVASNEDIFKYIKYDIILEFLRNNVTVESYGFSFLEILPYYILSNPIKIVLPFIEYIPKVGKLLDEFVKKLEKMYEGIKEKKDKLNKSSQSDILVDFLEKIEINEYSIYENDVTTKMVSKILEELKIGNNASSPIQNVLIIDDLDRIDPEHIFRLLNVFSAHFDNHYTIFGKGNKFGFDKVILVCHLENIKNIFKNKYGDNVDFKGYIDKFYSLEVFSFSNFDQLIRATLSVISKLKVKLGYYDFSYGSQNNFVRSLVTPLICHNLLSFRPVILIQNRNFTFPESRLFLNQEIQVDLLVIPFIVEIKLFTNLFGDPDDFIDALKQLERINAPINNIEYNFNDLIYFFTYQNHRFSEYEKLDIIIDDVFDASIIVNLKSSHKQWDKITMERSDKPGHLFVAEPKDYYRLLIKIVQYVVVNRFFI